MVPLLPLTYLLFVCTIFGCSKTYSSSRVCSSDVDCFQGEVCIIEESDEGLCEQSQEPSPRDATGGDINLSDMAFNTPDAEELDAAPSLDEGVTDQEDDVTVSDTQDSGSLDGSSN